MSEKQKKRKNAPRRRQERRFLPEASYSSRVASGVGMLGALLLGAGVFGQWIRDEPKPYAIYLVATGAALLVGSLLWTSRGPAAMRVGDAGVAFEGRNELKRVAWYEIERIGLQGDALLLKTTSAELLIPLGAHPKAIAKIVQEAASRIPGRIELSPAQHKGLPKLAEGDGELLVVDALQVAGQKCQHCGDLISIEKDARLCPACGAIYNFEHVPSECKICGGALGNRAVTV